MTAAAAVRPASRPVFRDDHDEFREQARRFVEREITPNLHAWEKAGIVPRDLWRKAGDAGLLCVTVPEEYGGAGGDFGHSAVVIEELARVNATAVGFTTHSEIVAPYIVAYGSEEQKQRWLPKMVSGEQIGVIAMSVLAPRKKPTKGVNRSALVMIGTSTEAVDEETFVAATQDAARLMTK